MDQSNHQPDVVDRIIAALTRPVDPVTDQVLAAAADEIKRLRGFVDEWVTDPRKRAEVIRERRDEDVNVDEAYQAGLNDGAKIGYGECSLGELAVHLEWMSRRMAELAKDPTR